MFPINLFVTTINSLDYCESPKSLRALKDVAKATSSGFLFMKAAIISTIAGKEQGSFLWKVQYRWRKVSDLERNKIIFANKTLRAELG